MKRFTELAGSFYGVKVPCFKRRSFFRKVMSYLNSRYSIETAIGKALRDVKLN